MMRSGCNLLVAMLLLVGELACAQDTQSQPAPETRVWHLQTGPDKVDAKLTTHALTGQPQNTVISFQIADGNSVLKMAEIAGLLDRVLNEMPGLGYATEKLQRIAFKSDNSDVQSGFNVTVAKSGLWKDHCLHVYACRQIGRVVSDYLISSGALEPLEPVLKIHHLKRTDVWIEEPGCSLVPKSTPRTAVVGIKSLSCEGLVLIDLQPQ